MGTAPISSRYVLFQIRTPKFVAWVPSYTTVHNLSSIFPRTCSFFFQLEHHVTVFRTQCDYKIKCSARSALEAIALVVIAAPREAS